MKLLVIGMVAALAASACSNETGILLNTTAHQSFDGEVDKLRFFVGVPAPEFADPNYYVDNYIDEGPLTEESFASRDLSSNPYRLMIRPPDVAVDPDGQTEDTTSQRYALGVFAYHNREPVGFGYISDPVGFVDGSVTKWTVEIRPLGSDDDANTTENCLRWDDGIGGFNIGSVDDRDCDGFDNGPDDCDDSDPNTYLGANEVADGRDNSCNDICDDGDELDSDRDGFTEFGRYGVCRAEMNPSFDCDTNTGPVPVFPGAIEFCDDVDSNCDWLIDEPTPCFLRSGDRCVQGESPCVDGVTSNLCGATLPETTTLGFELACAQTICVNEERPYQCLIRELGKDQHVEFSQSCKTYHTRTADTCSTNGGSIPLSDDGIELNVLCTYQIIGARNQQGYQLSLEEAVGGDVARLINSCQVKLNFETTEASGAARVLIALTRYHTINMVSENSVIHINLSNDPVDDCAEKPAGFNCTDPNP